MQQKLFLTALFIAFITLSVNSQNLTQTIRGHVVDADSHEPLIGAQVSLILSPALDEKKGATTDTDGQFRLANVPIGRVALQINYMGYEPLTVPNIVLNSVKEVVLNLEMRESTQKLREVAITASQNKGEAINEMAMLSTRSISPEETNRYAGGFNDPSRILSNFAGISNTQDGSNDIIVRGNSPKYVQWRLEGEQITNPNHFGDPSSVGGSVSILNNNVLAASDFQTGAFAPEFGDALSGVYDLRFRSGNDEKFEGMFALGLLGTEVMAEGPLNKRKNGSFLINYRYSTAGLLSELGLLGNVGGVLQFQDLSFKIVQPTRKAGIFTLYGLGGKSSFKFEDVTPALWVIPGDNAIRAELRNDFDKKAHLFNVGLRHSISLGTKTHLTTSLTRSDEGIEDNVFEAGIAKIYDDNGELLRDSVISRRLSFDGNLRKPVWRASTTLNHKFNARHKIQVGTKYALLDYRFEQNRYSGGAETQFALVDFSEQVSTVRNFISWRYRANERLAVVAGVHNNNVLLNSTSTLEPRLAVEYRATPQCVTRLGYGRHSSMESIHHYFAKVERPDGSVIEPNRDLDLLKADHFVLGYERRFGKDMRMKVDFYYQRLFDIPVENVDTSYFSTIVEGLDFRHVELVNAGKGGNYGVEVTFEKFFSHNWYMLVNGSLFESKYTPLDGKERDTPFNGRYLVNVLAGREFPGLGRKNNQTLTLNTRAFFGGARRIIPLLRDDLGNLAVNPAENRIWDYDRAFEARLDDPYQIQLSASYKWNKRRATHELFLNLDNITHHKGRIMEFYDESEPDKVGHMTQFGFFPNLMYRVYF
jgi:hypothetical protein